MQIYPKGQFGNRPSSRRKCIASALAVLCTTSGMNVMAQNELEEVLVTAQKREQSINDVGITVNAFSEEQIRDWGVRSAEDLEAMVPGLTVSNSQPSGVPVYTIRGVGFNDFTTSATSTVGLYFDGASIPYAVMTRGAIFDLARIEVLKGPQGDLYGRNSTAGQINFISQQPTEEFASGIRLDYSSFETTDLEAYVSGALSDSLRGRLSVKSIQSQEGWQESITRPGDTLGERDELALRGIVSWDINDDINLNVIGRYSQNQSDNVAGAPTSFAGELLPVDYDWDDADWSPGHRPQDDSEHMGLTATLNWDLGAASLTSITSYDDYNRDNARFDTSAIPQEDGDATNTTDIQVFSQELRLESAERDGVYWTAGVFYSQDDLDETYNLAFRETLGLQLENRYTQDSETIAIFGHVELDLSDQFMLTLGGRYTRDERNWSGCTFDSGDGSIAGFYNFFVTPAFLAPQGFTPSTLAPGDCAVFNDLPGSSGFGDFGAFSDSVVTEQPMGKVTLDYTPTEDLLLFGTISTGFKSGGFNGAGAQFHSQLAPYQEEELLSYEVGIKATLLDQRMQFNLSAFLYDYTDKQELTNFISPIGDIVGITNVPESEVSGVELELNWAIMNGLQLQMGIAYLDTEITEFTQNCPAGLFFPPPPDALPDGCPRPSAFGDVLTFDASGARLDNGPEWQATATLSYEFALSNALMAYVAGDVSYKDDNLGSVAAQDAQSLFYLPDYTLVNMRAGLRDTSNHWDLMVWGRNITDEYFWHSTNTSNSTTTRLHGVGATYGVTAAYNFF